MYVCCSNTCQYVDMKKKTRSSEKNTPVNSLRSEVRGQRETPTQAHNLSGLINLGQSLWETDKTNTQFKLPLSAFQILIINLILVYSPSLSLPLCPPCLSLPSSLSLPVCARAHACLVTPTFPPPQVISRMAEPDTLRSQ